MDTRKAAAEAAFREAANRRAALEVRLTEEQRARYQALRQKQEADLTRQQRRLDQRRQDYESEIRKQGLAPTLDMIAIDRNTPRALRDAAREYTSQGQWVADLVQAHERERDKFLERVIAGTEPEGQCIDPDAPRAGPLRE